MVTHATLQNQPESHTVAARSEGRGAAEFRPIVALAFIAGVLIPVSIAWLNTVYNGLPSLYLCVAGTALHRLRKERALLNGRATTTATVTHWERAEGLEGRHLSRVRYRFLGPDGKEYVGKATSQAELPAVGEMLPIFICALTRTWICRLLRFGSSALPTPALRSG